eukprot:scaffold301_cov243-Pinguiococcus_pyrenoidosus.AAC.6
MLVHSADDVQHDGHVSLTSAEVLIKMLPHRLHFVPRQALQRKEDRAGERCVQLLRRRPFVGDPMEQPHEEEAALAVPVLSMKIPQHKQEALQGSSPSQEHHRLYIRDELGDRLEPLGVELGKQTQQCVQWKSAVQHRDDDTTEL